MLYVGEGNNTAAALALALARFAGTRLRVAHARRATGCRTEHPGRRAARRRGPERCCDERHDMDELPADFDVVYTTRWQTTGTSQARSRTGATCFAPFQVDRRSGSAARTRVFMHDLPAHRGEEVTAEVLDGPASIAFAQAANKYHSAHGRPRVVPGRNPMTAACLDRVTAYRHLTAADRDPPDRRGIFFDPVDTEVGAWATVDLFEEESTVLDLGSGSGAAAAAVARDGPRPRGGHLRGERPVGVRAPRPRRAHPAGHLRPGRLRRRNARPRPVATPPVRLPDVIASNPPYVPVPPVEGSGRVSIDGGPDGLRLVRMVVGHAEALGSALSLTIGSYLVPRQAAALLAGHDYRIAGLTLAALRLGDYTVRHSDRVLALEAAGEGPLLRTDDGTVSYLCVGLSCRRARPAGRPLPGRPPRPPGPGVPVATDLRPRGGCGRGAPGAGAGPARGAPASPLLNRPTLTLGVEEEFFVVDAATRQLAVDATPVLTALGGPR